MDKDTHRQLKVLRNHPTISKNIVFKFLNRIIIEAENTNGKLQSDLDEALYKLEPINRKEENIINKEARILARKEVLYNNLITTQNKLHNSIKKLEKDRSNLITQLVKLRRNLDEANNQLRDRKELPT